MAWESLANVPGDFELVGPWTSFYKVLIRTHHDRPQQGIHLILLCLKSRSVHMVYIVPKTSYVYNKDELIFTATPQCLFAQ